MAWVGGMLKKVMEVFFLDLKSYIFNQENVIDMESFPDLSADLSHFLLGDAAYP